MMFKKYISAIAVASVVFAGAFALAANPGDDAGIDATTVWDGIFTDEQAARGKEVYDVSCIGCHAPTLRGTPGGPGIAGGRFTFNWNDRSVGELLTFIHENMPIGQAGTLTDQQYADLVAYILQTNEFPAGETELPIDPAALEGVLITRSAE